MNFAQLWDLAFSAFEVFVGVGLVWLIFIEPRLPAKTLSVPLMTVVAVVAAVAFFYQGWRKAGQKKLADQAAVEAADAAYEDEVG